MGQAAYLGAVEDWQKKAVSDIKATHNFVGMWIVASSVYCTEETSCRTADAGDSEIACWLDIGRHPMKCQSIVFHEPVHVRICQNHQQIGWQARHDVH